ncbi:OLC1v1015594C1 [Oldenlandia corymbosa var. corymbosa]|uniref:OLC1v1015594C1 n=1 Tax=Oldenlandia corymbosa var. corymbosa TaxID=529605 RepID=A0AAV1E432_OLDCO|nr:OLC1v1015594C1 [Oldenlandia corymbosa var. corymbosa]
MECWKKVKELGSGSYGKVFLATRVASYSHCQPSSMAVKTAERNQLFLLREEKKFLAEFNDGMSAPNPNIIQCFGDDTSVENGRIVYNLLMEYAAGGSLRELIASSSKGGGMPEFHVASRECSRVSARVTPSVKIADFGFARWVSEPEQPHDMVSHGTQDFDRFYNRGTAMYSSPESMTFGLHDTGTDIWSLRCIVYEMITGEHIWKLGTTNRDLLRQILGGKFQIPERCHLSQEAVDFLGKCLVTDPKYRWSASKLLQHPFIVNNVMIASQIHDIDWLNRKTDHQINSPFGVRDWVSKRQLFSITPMLEALHQSQKASTTS